MNYEERNVKSPTSMGSREKTKSNYVDEYSNILSIVESNHLNRGIGRSKNAIDFCLSMESVLVMATEHQAREVSREDKFKGQRNRVFSLSYPDRLRGINYPVIFDHHAYETMLWDLIRENRSLREDVKGIEAENAQLKAANGFLGHDLKVLKERSNRFEILLDRSIDIIRWAEANALSSFFTGSLHKGIREKLDKLLATAKDWKI